jgi:hypothetical protein
MVPAARTGSASRPSAALATTVVRSWYIVRESALRDQVHLERTLRHRGGHSEIRVNLVREDRAPERRPVPPWTCPARQERSRVLNPIGLVLVQNVTS